MKKIFTLLAVIMASLTAMAQTTFYGTWKNNSNSFPSFDNYVEVTVNDNGTSTIVLKDITFGNDVLGTITLNNVSTEQNGTGYSFSMGSQTTFDITEGNMGGVTKGAFEGWGTMDGENLQLIANYFDYGTTSLRYVKFNGTKVQTKPDGPTIVETETFSSDLLTSTAAGDTKTTKNANAILSKYSDNTYSLTLKPVETADASYGAITFSGLGFKEEDGETYISGYVDYRGDFTALRKEHQGRPLCRYQRGRRPQGIRHARGHGRRELQCGDAVRQGGRRAVRAGLNGRHTLKLLTY